MKLFDLHCDTLTACLDSGDSLYTNQGQLDISRGAGLFSQWAQVMAVYVPDTMNAKEGNDYLLRALDFLEEQVTTMPSVNIVRTALDLHEAFGANQVALVPALENGLAIAEDLHTLAALSARGIAYITITWNGDNPLGHGCMSKNCEGLTPLGKEAVQQMLLCGIIPDVSHLNSAGFWDVVSLCDGSPIIAGHSVSRTIHDHPRNLTDEQFLAILQTDGIVGLNVCDSQLGDQSFATFAKHLEHFLSLGGEDQLALGLDLDGTPLKKEWSDITFLPRLYDYLLKLYSKQVIDKIFFENAQAFFVKTLTRKEECITIGL